MAVQLRKLSDTGGSVEPLRPPPALGVANLCPPGHGTPATWTTHLRDFGRGGGGSTGQVSGNRPAQTVVQRVLFQPTVSRDGGVGCTKSALPQLLHTKSHRTLQVHRAALSAGLGPSAPLPHRHLHLHFRRRRGCFPRERSRDHRNLLFAIPCRCRCRYRDSPRHPGDGFDRANFLSTHDPCAVVREWKGDDNEDTSRKCRRADTG